MGRCFLRPSSNSVRPECPPWRAYRGTGTNLSPVILSAAKNLASPPLKPRCVRLRACRILLTPERSFSPAASYFLSTATRSNQEAPPRCLRRPIAKRLDGPLRFAAGVGVLDRPSLACLKRLRHPASPASARGYSTPSLRCSAQPDGEEHQKQQPRQQPRQQLRPLPPSYRRKPVSRGQGCVGSRCTASVRPN